jgi:hypothetical protein
VGIQFLEVGKETSGHEHLEQLDEGLLMDIVPFTGTDDAQLTAEGNVTGVPMSANRRLDCKSKETID